MTRKPESAQPRQVHAPILGEDEFKGVYKRPPRERSHLCDVFCRLLDAFSQMKEARMFKPATAAAVLVDYQCQSMRPVIFPWLRCKRHCRARQSPLPTVTSRMSMIRTKTRSATLSSDHER